jgi:hypothetical protein
MIFRIGFFADEDRRHDNDMKLTRISIRRSVRSTRHPQDKLQRPSSQRLMTAKVAPTLMETILHSTTHPDTFRDGYGVLVQSGRADRQSQQRHLQHPVAAHHLRSLPTARC